MKIPYTPFHHTDELLKEEFQDVFRRFLDKKWYILGSEVEKFENDWAAYCNSKYAVGVGNGYDALFLSLKALDIGTGDEVIVPAHTFAATALAVVNAGARPVLVDADRDTFTIDADKIAEKITARTKAVIVVHIYGNPCEMDKIAAICEKNGIKLIEDNAQSHGAAYGGRKTGSFGALAATSFYPVKNLGALGDGGAVNTSDEILYEKIKLLRSYGSPDKHAFPYAGVNSRLDELQAAFLNVKLRHLDEWNQQRRQQAEWYRRQLQGAGDIQLMSSYREAVPVYHIFPILTSRREELRHFLAEKGVQTLRHYPTPYYLEPAFTDADHTSGRFPVTDEICACQLSLPLYPGLSMNEIEYVAGLIRDFFNH